MRQGRIGDLGWMMHRQAVVYAKEFRYSAVFETYLHEGAAVFLANFDAKRDRIWIAELDGRVVGFVAIQHDPDRRGWAKLRWFFVEAESRGHGLGKRLLKAAVAFSRKAGYRGILLWTVDHLETARALYEEAGFTLAFHDSKPCPWAPWCHEQRWELRLAGPQPRS
ncbi:MAG: GNAT family N-acetyltransferase [Candidatus Thermoplasmatota archaeon]